MHQARRADHSALLIAGSAAAQVRQLPDDAFERAVAVANTIELVSLLLVINVDPDFVRITSTGG